VLNIGFAIRARVSVDAAAPHRATEGAPLPVQHPHDFGRMNPSARLILQRVLLSREAAGRWPTRRFNRPFIACRYTPLMTASKSRRATIAFRCVSISRSISQRPSAYRITVTTRHHARKHPNDLSRLAAAKMTAFVAVPGFIDNFFGTSALRCCRSEDRSAVLRLWSAIIMGVWNPLNSFDATIVSFQLNGYVKLN